MNIVYIASLIFFFILGYAVLKEREELGCYRVSIGRQCIDEESVYVKGTKATPSDTCDDLVQRISSLLSYHEKAGVWKRCFILSFIATIFVYLTYNLNKKLNNIFYFFIIFLLIFTLMYFYHNYINYHHFRNLKRNGEEILSFMKQKCFKAYH